MSYSLNIKELVSESWVVVKGKIWAFIGMLGIMWLINIVPNSITSLIRENNLAVLLVTVSFMVPQVIISIGVIKYILELLKKPDSVDFGIIFTQYTYFWKFILASLLYNLIVAVGLVFLVVPGIYLGLRLQFFSYLVVDRGLGPVDAIKESFAMTKDRALDLLLLAFVVVALNMLTIITFFVGLLITIPMTMVIYAKVYNSLLDVVEA